MGKREFNPSIFGKASTLAQVTTVAVVLLHQLIPSHWVVVFETWALAATVLLTVVSGLNYAWVAARRAGTPGGGGSAAKD